MDKLISIPSNIYIYIYIYIHIMCMVHIYAYIYIYICMHGLGTLACAVLTEHSASFSFPEYIYIYICTYGFIEGWYPFPLGYVDKNTNSTVLGLPLIIQTRKGLKQFNFLKQIAGEEKVIVLASRLSGPLLPFFRALRKSSCS